MAIIERQSGEADIRAAIGKYREAIRIDPGYALAHWGAGNAYENLYYHQKEKDPAVLDKMYFHFNKASEIDPNFAETNLGLGWYHFNRGDNRRAHASFKKALALEPGKAIVNRDAGAFLMSVGLYRQAIPRLVRAAGLSPRDTLPLDQIAQSWMYLGECEKALRYVEKAIDIDGLDEDAWRMRPILLILTGRLDEADRAIGTLEEHGWDPDRIPFLRELVAALRADRGPGHVLENGAPGIAPGGTYAFLALGLKDEAIANIRAGIDRGFANGMYLYSYPSLAKNPFYRAIRDDPRFRAILKSQKDAYIRELKPLEKL
jgi:tetratricopeptide (TPR) repeat protein